MTRILIPHSREKYYRRSRFLSQVPSSLLPCVWTSVHKYGLKSESGSVSLVEQKLKSWLISAVHIWKKRCLSKRDVHLVSSMWVYSYPVSMRRSSPLNHCVYTLSFSVHTASGCMVDRMLRLLCPLSCLYCLLQPWFQKQPGHRVEAKTREQDIWSCANKASSYVRGRSSCHTIMFWSPSLFGKGWALPGCSFIVPTISETFILCKSF